MTETIGNPIEYERAQELVKIFLLKLLAQTNGNWINEFNEWWYS